MPLKIGCVAAGWRVVLGREAVGDRLVEQSWPPLPRCNDSLLPPAKQHIVELFAKQHIVEIFDEQHIVEVAEEDVAVST